MSLSKENYPGMVEDLSCHCGANMVLRDSEYGIFYGCSRFPDCKGTHGAHPDGEPLGIPADEETRRWREKCHQVFDKLWKQGEMSRQEAYEYLANLTGLPSDEAHISRFDKETCQEVFEELLRESIRG